jgi:hypothetical protein
MAILLTIFTHLDLESIRTLKVEEVHTCINLSRREDRASCIPQYQVILDLCPIEVITHFLKLRKKIWKTSDFIFAGSVSCIPLTSESLSKIISIQLGKMNLSEEDLNLIRGAFSLSTEILPSPKSFNKTSNILFRKYRIESKLLGNSLELRKQEILSELTQDLYNTSSEERLEYMISGFVNLELLDWCQRNMLDSLSKKVL